MNDFNDRITKRERLFVFLVPALFLLGFGLFMVRFIMNLGSDFEINGHSGFWYNVLGGAITGYILSCECTIIHYMLNQIRKSKGIVKALLIFVFVPAMFGGLIPAAIGTVPYFCYSLRKINRIKMDREGTFSKANTILLIALAILDIVILIAYFITQ